MLRQLIGLGLLMGSCALLGILLNNFLSPYYIVITVYIGINIILGTSLNLINGYTGQFSLGHAGFMAIGGYVSAVITYFGSRGELFPSLLLPLSGTPLFLLALFMGSLAAGAAGLCVGLPSLRLKGDYLAIVTLGFGEIIRVLILNIDIIGGARGFPGIPQYTNLFWIFFLTSLTLVILYRIANSTYGRVYLSIREDEIASQVVGVPVTRCKVQAFVIGSFFAGLCGGLLAHYITYLNPASFTFLKSFEAIIIVVLGGMGSMLGSTIAAILITILPEALRPLQEITRVDVRLVIYPLLLIALMLLRPHGLMGGRKAPPEFFWRKKSHEPSNATS